MASGWLRREAESGGPEAREDSGRGLAPASLASWWGDGIDSSVLGRAPRAVSAAENEPGWESWAWKTAFDPGDSGGRGEHSGRGRVAAAHPHPGLGTRWSRGTSRLRSVSAPTATRFLREEGWWKALGPPLRSPPPNRPSASAGPAVVCLE